MSQYDRIKKRADAKALQNRQKRAQRKANQYNDGKLNKTQQKYVAGDIVSSASTRAYGYKKFGIQGDSYITEKGRSKTNQAKINRGENPYELKYVYDGKERTVPGGTRADGSTYGSFKSRKRKLTDEEKEVYKKTGDINIDKYKKNYEYSIMSSYNKKPKKFRDNLNTNKWDGMKVAKNKGGGFNYVAGFAKDVVLDPVIDVMRGADYLSGIATGALAGGIEESKNVIEALATGDKSKVDFKRPIKNVKESIQSSNKTGWAKGMGDYFNDATKRNDKKEIERIKNNKNMTDAHKQKLIDDLNAKTDSKGHQMFRNIAGFIGDLAMPVDVGAGIGRLIKGTTTNASKSFKEMVNGTGDISTAFTPDKGRMQEALNKFAERRKNVKPSDGKFINEMYHETKPMNDLKIYDEDNARRLRNTLDNGYDLQMANDVKKTIKSNPTTQKLGKFLDNIEPKLKPINADENIYFKTIANTFEDDIDELVRNIDDMDMKQADRMIDWLEENRPDIYKKYVDDFNDIDDYVADAIQEQNLNDFINSKKTPTPKVEKYNKAKQSKYYNDVMEDNAINSILDAFVESKPKLTNRSGRIKEYNKRIKSLSKEMSEGKFTSKELDNIFKDFNPNDTTVDIKRQFVNNKFFDGQEVITKGVGNNELNGFIESFYEIAKLKEDYVNALNSGGKLKINLSKNTKKFLNIPEDEIVEIGKTFVNGKVIETPEQLVDVLTNALNNKASSYTDGRYNAKFQYLANKYGYNSKELLQQEIKELKNQRKLLDKQPTTPTTLDEKMKLSSRIKELSTKLNDRQIEWNNIKSMDENVFDDFIATNHPDIMNKLKFYKDRKRNKEIETLSNQSNVKNVVNDVIESDNAKIIDNKRTKFVDDFESVRSGSRTTDITKNDEIFNESKLLKSVGLEPVINIPKLAKNYKPVYSDLEKMPGAKNVVSNVKKLLTKIVEYDTPTVRKIDGQMQIAPREYESKVLRKELNRQIAIMRKADIKDYMWFEDIKRFKADLLKKTEHGKFDVNELAGASIKGRNKMSDDIRIERDMNAKAKELFMQDEYERILNASNPEELFMSTDYGKFIASHGDNVGVKLPNNSSVKNKVDKIAEPSQTKPKEADEILNDFDEFNQTENVMDLKRNPIDTSDKVKKKSNKPSIEEINAILERVDKAYGKSNNPTPLDNAIKKDKPPTFNEFKKFFTDTEDTHMKYEDSKVYDIYKSWLNSWKKGLTVYNPGWHVQNFFQNKGQNYLALGSDAFGSQKDARNILKEIKGESNKANYIVDKKNWKAYSPQELAKLAVDNNVVDGLGEDIQNARGILRPIENAIDNSGLMKLLNKSEETARLHHFIKQLERGMSPEEASKSVNKYLFDYGKKSKFDKVMSDFVDPFWVFHKNNARLLTQASLENPGKAANIIRATNELENGLKDEDKNSKKGDKYQSLVGSFEDDVNGDTYDYLYKENILPSVDDAIPLGRDELETKFNPLIKIALEQSRGEGAFGNKIVDKEKAGWNEVTKDERLLEIVKDLNFVGNPLVKAVSDSNKRQEQADEGKQSQETSDKQILLDWIKYITGNKGNYYRNSR